MVVSNGTYISSNWANFILKKKTCIINKIIIGIAIIYDLGNGLSNAKFILLPNIMGLR